ncbi:MAG: hypothetical protein BWY79_01000 [Actinobacteria bacterium ADurb.Bin444]|nr:MAG: hypothetical protein BWY79_01000 [Actinobacteria bacterium ADurb.Bin444]
MVVKRVLESGDTLQQVAARGVNHALGLAGGARGVENEERILGIHFHARDVLGVVGIVQDVVPPHVAAFDPVDVDAGVLDHDALLNTGSLGHGGVGGTLGVDLLAAAERSVGGDEDLGLGVDETVAEGLSRETTEAHAVDGAETCAGQHSHRELRDHGEVQRDAVALLDAELGQAVGDSDDLIVQLTIREGVGVVRVVTFHKIGDLVLVGRAHPAVEAVVGGVQLAAFEPRDLRIGPVVILDLVPLLVPDEEFIGQLGPEVVRVLDGPLVHLVVLLFGVDPCGLLQVFRYGKD